MQTSFRAKELELIANSRKGIATRTILKLVNMNQNYCLLYQFIWELK